MGGSVGPHRAWTGVIMSKHVTAYTSQRTFRLHELLGTLNQACTITHATWSWKLGLSQKHAHPIETCVRFL